MKEKRVNGSELKIDRDCENIFALFCPVAIDLRFLLAVLKINSNLERIGDIAEGIAKYYRCGSPFHPGIAGCHPYPADVRGIGQNAGRYPGSF
jgi:phosphate uptake regulator